MEDNLISVDRLGKDHEWIHAADDNIWPCFTSVFQTRSIYILQFRYTSIIK